MKFFGAEVKLEQGLRDVRKHSLENLSRYEIY